MYSKISCVASARVRYWRCAKSVYSSAPTKVSSQAVSQQLPRRDLLAVRREHLLIGDGRDPVALHGRQHRLGVIEVLWTTHPWDPASIQIVN